MTVLMERTPVCRTFALDTEADSAVCDSENFLNAFHMACCLETFRNFTH